MVGSTRPTDANQSRCPTHATEVVRVVAFRVRSAWNFGRQLEIPGSPTGRLNALMAQKWPMVCFVFAGHT